MSSYIAGTPSRASSLSSSSSASASASSSGATHVRTLRGDPRRALSPTPAAEQYVLGGAPLPSPPPRAHSRSTTNSTTITNNSVTTDPEAYASMRAQYDQIGAFFGGGSRRSSSPRHTQSQNQSQSQSQGPRSSPRRAHPSRQSTDTHSSGTSGTSGNSSVALPPYTAPGPGSHYDARGPVGPERAIDGDLESLPSYSKLDEYDATFNRKLFIYGFLFFPLWVVGIIAPFVAPAHDPARDNRSKEDQEADDAHMRVVEIRWAKRCAAALLAFVILVVLAVVLAVTMAKR